jgi:RNA recognition motif-containing protein
MTSTKHSMTSLYHTLRNLAFQDPILAAIANGKLSWADAMTEQDEANYQNYMTHGEGAEMMAQFREAMARENEKNNKNKRRGVHWNDSVEVFDVPFETVKTRSAPMQVQQVTTTVLFNPNQIKTLIARNLPRDVTSDELRALFEKHGPVRDAYIPKNLDTNSPYYGTIKGFALIKFMSHTDSTRAFVAEQTRMCLRGKMITIEFAKEDR